MIQYNKHYTERSYFCLVELKQQSQILKTTHKCIVRSCIDKCRVHIKYR